MGTEDELKRCGQAAAALMGVAAARAKQVAEQLLGSRESAKEDAKQRAGSLVDEGRRAAADVISALRKEASVLFRDLDHLEEHLRGGKAQAPAPSAGGASDDATAGPARKAATARAAAEKKAPPAKAAGARKTAPAAKAGAGATSPAAKTPGRKRAAAEKVAGAGKKATASRATTARKAGGASEGGPAGGPSSRGRA